MAHVVRHFFSSWLTYLILSYPVIYLLHSRLNPWHIYSMITFLSVFSTNNNRINLLFRAADLFRLRRLAQRPEETRRILSSLRDENHLRPKGGNEERQRFSTTNQALNFYPISTRALLIPIHNTVFFFFTGLSMTVCVRIRVCPFVKFLLQDRHETF